MKHSHLQKDHERTFRWQHTVNILLHPFESCKLQRCGTRVPQLLQLYRCYIWAQTRPKYGERTIYFNCASQYLNSLRWLATVFGKSFDQEQLALWDDGTAKDKLGFFLPADERLVPVNPSDDTELGRKKTQKEKKDCILLKQSRG